MPFPADFRWGSATSSYQIEGAIHADGRGPSIWDTFCDTPGKVLNGDSGAVACEHYERWPEDLALLQQLGVNAYRFSVAWPRILPTGLERSPNPKGLDFYEKLVDALLAAGIEPWLTLNHWDLPQGLQDAGGWPSRDTCERFVAFADAVSRRLGDRVGHWITHNEPWVLVHLGYFTGVHAPGERDFPRGLAAGHHLLLSHGQAVPVLRSNSPGSQVGMVVNLCPGDAASDSPQDAEALRRFDGEFNRWYLDPLFGKGYPQDVVEDHRRDGHLPPGPLPFVRPGDMDVIATPTDFLGINYYSRAVVRAEEPQDTPQTVFQRDEKTDFDWEVYPEGLRDILIRVHRESGGQPLLVTENGAAYATPPGPDGTVPDEARRSYLERHIDACEQAIAAGVDLRGYFAWSLLDNFEWAEGYDKRFGLVWVDFDTQERVPKDSFKWYAERIKQG